MEEKVLVSVVIPAFNSGKYIEKCLKATVNQTYKNLEIIVVVRESDDNTLDICKKYETRDGRIKLLETSMIGASASRNIGIANASGDYIAFFDADDYPEDDLIENYVKAVEELSDKDVAFIVCGMFFDNEINKNVDNTISVLETGHGYIWGEVYHLGRSSLATLAWLKLTNFVTNKFYDLRFIKDSNLSFDEEVHIAEDLKFNLDYLDKCEGSIGMINKPLYHYIKHSNNSLSLTYHENDIDTTKQIYSRFVDWEEKQTGATPENVMVVKAMYLTDWISRLTTFYEAFKGKGPRACVKRRLRKELCSREFRQMLKEVHSAGKISTFRYLCLRTGFYEVFYFFRGFYQLLKG